MYPNPPGTSFAPNIISPGDPGDSPLGLLETGETEEDLLLWFGPDLLSYWHKCDADLSVQFPHGYCLSHYYTAVSNPIMFINKI
jgi:hypothetical protein